MCTLILAWRAFRDAPVVVAANRDESYGRPSRPPAVLDADPGIVAPLDESAGGTWIGYNDRGVLGALTNRWTDEDRSGERSRGLLVRDALREESAEAATRSIEHELAERSYAGFNFVLADAQAAILLEWDDHLQVTPLDPGLHVIMNVGYDETFDVPDRFREPGERQVESARRVRVELQPEADESAGDWLDRAGAVLGTHEYGVCVHGDEFGTRSSSLIALGDRTVYRFADGPPCQTAYELVESGI